MASTVFPAASAASKTKKVASFKSNGTWTVPADVTYAIAHVLGGGGGSGYTGSPGDGGASSVVFSTTVTANGGLKIVADGSTNQLHHNRAGADNSGQGATFQGSRTDISWNDMGSLFAGNGALIESGSTVTPADSITVNIGAGGVAGTGGAAGGSGFVFIEYYEQEKNDIKNCRLYY